MSADLHKLLDKLKPVLERLDRYKVLLFVAVLVGMYGFLVLQINQLSSSQPDEDAVTERLQGRARPKIDESVVRKMEELQEQNVQVQTLFKQARDNPFSE